MIDTEAIVNQYYGDNEHARELLLKHSRQVRDYALELLERHPELDFVDKTFVAEAAMLHDIGIFMCDAPDIFCRGTHNYIEHGYLGAGLLRKEGLPRHALVCERHTGMGISLDMILRNDYPLPRKDMQPVSVEEKLICYADKFFSKSQPENMYTPEKVRERMLRFGESEAAKFDILNKMFG